MAEQIPTTLQHVDGEEDIVTIKVTLDHPELGSGTVKIILADYPNPALAVAALYKFTHNEQAMGQLFAETLDLAFPVEGDEGEDDSADESE